MSKTILITGSTDGIGLLTAKKLAADGHTILLHGRSEKKLAIAATEIGRGVETYCADLSSMESVRTLAKAVKENHQKIDVLINNAGVFKAPKLVTEDGYDIRIVVNTVAPYLLTKLLMPLMTDEARVINLSSAAQASVDLNVFAKSVPLNDNEAYAQSKLALTMWSIHLAETLGNGAPSIIAINPASLLASKMVKDAYGVEGNDLSIGADILVRAALSDEFADASGRYFDNDQGRFASPHPDALNAAKNEQVTQAVEAMLTKLN